LVIGRGTKRFAGSEPLRSAYEAVRKLTKPHVGISGLNVTDHTSRGFTGSVSSSNKHSESFVTEVFANRLFSVQALCLDVKSRPGASPHVDKLNIYPRSVLTKHAWDVLGRIVKNFKILHP
jgi:hypothetical protein